MCIICNSFAAIAPRISGGTSAISSALIIYIVYKSETRLRTIYHRIMFGMSLSDIISSVAMALSTLPMPVDLPYQPKREFVGTRIGNTATCEAQGFCYIFGYSTMFAYNAALCLYNTCAIAFQMEEEKIKRRVEPFLHLIPLFCGFALAVPPLVLQLYNPVSFDAWCSIAHSGNVRNSFNFDIIMIAVCGFLFTFVIVCFGLIIRRVRKVDRAFINDYPDLKKMFSSRAVRKILKAQEKTKIVFTQAVAYFISFLLTLGILLTRGIIDEPLWMIRLWYVMMPLQGFFNMLIFVYYKIFNYRRANPEVSRWETFVLLLTGSSSTDPIMFSRISHLEIGQVSIEDEQGGEVVVFERVEGSEGGGEAFVGDDGVDHFEQDQDLSGFEASSLKSSLGGFVVTSSSKLSHSKNRVGGDDVEDGNSMSRGGLSGFSSFLPSSNLSSVQEGNDVSSSPTRGGRSLDHDLSVSNGVDENSRSQNSSWFSRFQV